MFLIFYLLLSQVKSNAQNTRPQSFFSYLLANLFAQSLTLDELIKIRGMDTDGVHNYLSARGWRFNDASEGVFDNYNTSIWSFGQTVYSDRAKAFVKLFTKEGYLNVISFQTINKTSYDLIRSKALNYKMQKESSKVEEGTISTTYVGENYRVKLSVTTDKYSNIPVYYVHLYKKPAVHYANLDDLIQTNDETKLSEVEPEESSEEEVGEEAKEEKISYYKSKISRNVSQLKVKDIVNDIAFKDACIRTCNLIESPYFKNRIIKNLSPNSVIHILSTLRDENHDYYLVFVDGYFGYVYWGDLESNKPLEITEKENTVKKEELAQSSEEASIPESKKEISPEKISYYKSLIGNTAANTNFHNISNDILFSDESSRTCSLFESPISSSKIIKPIFPNTKIHILSKELFSKGNF